MQPSDGSAAWTRRLQTRPAFKTLTIAFVIGVGMFLAFSDGWAKVEDIALSLKRKSMTPGEINYEQRRDEERRVFNAFWDRERTSPRHSAFWGFAATDPSGTTLTVRVPEAEAMKKDAASGIACGLLLPPVSLKQELFREISVVTPTRETPSQRAVWIELGAMAHDEGCDTGNGSSPICRRIQNAHYHAMLTEQFSIPLPYDMKECESKK